MANDENGQFGYNPYGGAALVPRDSVLRRVPTVFSAEEILRFNALIDAADIVEHGWRRLLNVAEQLGSLPQSVRHEEKIEIFSSCWQIIDQSDVIRQIIEKLSRSHFRDELYYLRKVKCLRNKRAHISQNIKNLSKKKHLFGSIFGSISYVCFTDIDNFKGNLISILSDQILLQDTDIPTVNPVGKSIYNKFSLFRFAAMDIEVEFEPLMLHLKSVVLKVEAAIQRAFIPTVIPNTSSEIGSSNSAIIITAEIVSRTSAP